MEIALPDIWLLQKYKRDSTKWLTLNDSVPHGSQKDAAIQHDKKTKQENSI